MTGSGEFPGEFQAGDIVGGTYTILGYIGRGSMGHLYHARHTMLNTEYALKTLTSEKVTELDWKRFQNEAQATAVMNHPNVVTIYNLGLHERRLPFYVMDLLQGADLGKKIRTDGPLSIKEALTIFLEVCSGIGYAHKKGIIHRDIKPANIFLLEAPDPAGAKVKVVDFGIAKLTVTKNQETQSLTAVGDVIGTPFYMSPEQCMGKRVDARSDIYSLGCTLYEALTGVLPFRARNPTETMLLQVSAPPPRLSRGEGGQDFPDALQLIIATALAKEPAERYQTMDQLATDLAAVIESERPIVAVPDGVPIEMVEAPATLRVTAMPEATGKRLPPEMGVMAVLIAAGLLAYGGWAYWQSLYKIEKSRQQVMAEQLKILGNANVSDANADDKAGAQMKLLEEKNPTAAESELPPHQLYKASLGITKPFSTFRKEDGKTCRVFDFPSDVVIGHLSSGSPPLYLKAEGELSFPQWETITFTPAEIVGRFPNCLKRFQAGDIYCVKISTRADSDDVFQATTNIPGVQKLDFYDSTKLTEKSLDTLRKFHALNVFIGSKSNTDGEALSRVDSFNNVEQLYLQHTTNILSILKKIRPWKKISRLGIGPSDLKVPEFEAIADLTNLTYLELSGNHVTAKDLAILSKLHNLTQLKLQYADLDGSAIETIKTFKSLTFLGLPGTRLTNKDLAILLALPLLTTLDLRDTGLDASSVKMLESLKSLKELQIDSGKLKPGDLEKIKTALPGVKVS